MALLNIDLRQHKESKFICTVSLCGKFGEETVHFHRTVEGAERSMEFIERTGCGGQCWGNHHLVVIPRGHLMNMKKRAHYKASGYLRWLIDKDIVKAPKPRVKIKQRIRG